MNYQQQLRTILGFLYNETKCYATSSTHCVPYEKVKNGYGMWIGTTTVQDDIYEEWQNSQYVDKIQTLDFDDEKECVVVMMWKTNKKRLKEYTLKEWESFCKDALTIPPFEDDEQLDEWFATHKIHITANDCVMELEYDADAVNEIEFGLREIYEAIHGSGEATTGNTVGSEYRNATWKDILRFYVLDKCYNTSNILTFWVKECIDQFTQKEFMNAMKKIDEQTSINDELQVNFFKLDTKDLWKIFDKEERKRAFEEILCSNIRIEELYNQEGKCADKVVITDYSIKPSGDIVGWHYGVDWDKDSEDNQYYIQNYIEEATR